MLYYRINPQYDGAQVGKKTLIANELYTPNEMRKYNIPAVCATGVDISKKNVFMSFGARFECKNKH